MHVQPWILISPLLICTWTWNVQALMGLQCSLNSVRTYLLNIWNQLWLGDGSVMMVPENLMGTS
jgi:hypothetical protein